MEKKRIAYFDLLKTISIILVVYVHYPLINKNWPSNLSMIIPIVAVPIFFMVNGALLFSKEKIDLKKHYLMVLSLVIGIITWKILIWGVSILTRNITIRQFSVTQLMNFFFAQGKIKQIPTEHFWFMYSLIRIYLIFPFFKVFVEKYPRCLKYILIFTLLFSFGIELLNFLFSFYSGKMDNKFTSIQNTWVPIEEITYISYFILGYLLHKENYKENSNKSIRYILTYIIFIFIGLALLIIAKYMQTKTWLIGNYTPIRNMYTKIGTLIMASALFTLCSSINIKENRFIEFIGKRTMNIYLPHMLVVKYLLKYTQNLRNYNYNGVIFNSIKTIIVILITLLITEIIKKIKPIKKLLLLK